MYENSFRLRGKTYDYKIPYENIKKFMLLPKPDDLHTLISIGLDPPLRQGQTRYPFLVMQFKREEEITIELNMTKYVGFLPLPSIIRLTKLGNFWRRSTRASCKNAMKPRSIRWSLKFFVACPVRG